MSIRDTEKQSIHFEFHCQQNKQKYFVQILLTYGDINLKQLACSLSIPINLLLDVSQGVAFLKGKQALLLAELFLTLFGEAETN